MITHTSTWLCLTILCSSSFAIRFENKEPSKEVLEGFDVTLSCVIQDIQGSSDVTFHWSVPAIKGKTLSSTSLDQGDRFIVTEEIAEPRGDSATVTGSSTLTISNATISDDGVYSCQLLPKNGGDILATIETDLSVIQFDPQTNAACWVEPTSMPVLKDTTVLRCATRQSTSIQLTWEAEGVELEGEQSESAGVTFLLQELAVPLDWDEIPLLCLEKDTRKVLCRTSVTLLYPPVVSVIPDGEILYGSEARFNCSTMARPEEVTGYRWWYDEIPVRPNAHHRFNRVRLENDNKTMVLPDLSAADDAGFNITCEATNDVGTGESKPYKIVGNYPTPVSNIVGPILLAVILIILLAVVLAFFFWWRGQRRMVRQISTKRKKINNARQKSELPTSLNVYSGSASFVAVSPMDLEAIGYGPDVSSKPSQVEPNDRQDRDSGVGDDGIRPIPRRASISSSLGKANFGYEDDEQSQTDMNFESPDAPVDPSEEKLKSYSYEVNPNFNNYRRSQTFDVVAIPSSENGDSDTEIKSIPSDAEGSDDESGHSATPSGHIVSTNL